MNGEKEYFDEWAKTYDDVEGEDWPVFLKWAFSEISKKLELTDNSTVLDLGTGTGRLILELSKTNRNCRFIGLDVSEEMIERARENSEEAGLNAEFIVGSMEKLSLPSGSVDFVVSCAAIHHVKEKEKLFREILRVLKPGGRLVYADFFEKTDEEYEKRVGGLRRRFPGRTKEFTQSLKESYDSLTKEQKQEHPTEYHVEPGKVKGMLTKVGFGEAEIIHSLDTYVAVISAVKSI